MAQAAKIEHIRAELFKIADQYEGMATSIGCHRMGKRLLRDVTVVAVDGKRAP